MTSVFEQIDCQFFCDWIQLLGQKGRRVRCSFLGLDGAARDRPGFGGEELEADSDRSETGVRLLNPQDLREMKQPLETAVEV